MDGPLDPRPPSAPASSVKIVLVNPPSPPEYRVSRGLMGGFGMAVNPELLYPPIELAHVAGLLEHEGHEVVIFDGDAVDADVAAARKAIVAEAPDFVLLDSSSTSLTQDLGLAGDVRADLGVPVFMLGSQVTYTPDDLFQNSSIDGVVRGEPEHTVSEVAARIAGGSRTYEDIAGVTWADADGAVHQEAERDKIKDLDDLPIPSRHLLKNGVYKFPGLDGPVTTVKSSRGCPLNCSFCGYTLAQGLRFRFRSPEHVVQELVDLHKNHGLKYVVFRDPIFTTRKDRVMDICDGILREGLDLEWQCETAVKTLSPELLEKMAEAGCTHISLGIESGNAEIQKKHCGNKLNKLDQAKEVFEVCRRVEVAELTKEQLDWDELRVAAAGGECAQRQLEQGVKWHWVLLVGVVVQLASRVSVSPEDCDQLPRTSVLAAPSAHDALPTDSFLPSRQWSQSVQSPGGTMTSTVSPARRPAPPYPGPSAGRGWPGIDPMMERMSALRLLRTDQRHGAPS